MKASGRRGPGRASPSSWPEPAAPCDPTTLRAASLSAGAERRGARAAGTCAKQATGAQSPRPGARTEEAGETSEPRTEATVSLFASFFPPDGKSERPRGLVRAVGASESQEDSGFPRVCFCTEMEGDHLKYCALKYFEDFLEEAAAPRVPPLES